MPLRKTPKGWMWGSKGPFSTKAKALQVARDAYASGYKGEKKSYPEPAICEKTIPADKKLG